MFYCIMISQTKTYIVYSGGNDVKIYHIINYYKEVNIINDYWWMKHKIQHKVKLTSTEKLIKDYMRHWPSQTWPEWGWPCQWASVSGQPGTPPSSWRPVVWTASLGYRSWPGMVPSSQCPSPASSSSPQAAVSPVNQSTIVKYKNKYSELPLSCWFLIVRLWQMLVLIFYYFKCILYCILIVTLL